MEIKLKTTPADDHGEIILDEHGALWKYSGDKVVHGIFLATTKGSNGQSIHGYYQNGTLFIVNWTDARNYFNSMNPRSGCDMHGM